MGGGGGGEARGRGGGGRARDVCSNIPPPHPSTLGAVSGACKAHDGSRPRQRTAKPLVTSADCQPSLRRLPNLLPSQNPMHTSLSPAPSSSVAVYFLYLGRTLFAVRFHTCRCLACHQEYMTCADCMHAHESPKLLGSSDRLENPRISTSRGAVACAEIHFQELFLSELWQTVRGSHVSRCFA